MSGPFHRFQVIIHGHFYQPPRENPWTGVIERQDSAAPFHDWNERITAECYRPNSRSRVLDARGRVLELVNNYRHLSFNFGPTLLSHLEEHDPDTLRRIVEADAQSRAERGHGNAMAQAYNHMILPLATPRDRWTQIQWGLADFRSRFGREAEAMWLPETAANLEVLSDLARAGMKFVLLAPSQAARIRNRGGDRWRDVSGGDIPTHRPYLCRTPAGDIGVFFYHAGLSRAVAFEHLLRNASLFADRLQAAAEEAPPGPDRLVFCCTDGESYGHHEPFGDMCLAYLATREAPARGISFTNPGRFLADHPPEYEVELKGGEGTAWSCAHGVGRWKEDCGCTTGGPAGWNQTWRAPLRRALDRLRDELDALFESEARGLLKEPWAARDDFLPVVLNRPLGAADRFLKLHAARALDDAERAEVFRLMHMQRYGMLMYTSCGWFFSDISGIETIANLRYALRALQLAERVTERPMGEAFRKELASARSNIGSEGTGLDILERRVVPQMLSREKIAAHHMFEGLIAPLPAVRTVYRYRVQVHESGSEQRGELQARSCRLTVTSRLTGGSGTFDTVLIVAGALRLRAFVRPYHPQEEPPDLGRLLSEVERDGFGEACRLERTNFAFGFGLHEMDLELRDRVIEARLQPLLTELSDLYEQAFSRHEGLIRTLSVFGVQLPRELRLLASYAGGQRFDRAVERAIGGEELDAAVEMAALLTALGAAPDKRFASTRMGGRLRELLKSLIAHPQPEEGERFIRLLQSARAAQLDVDEAGLQDLLADALPRLLDRLLQNGVGGRANAEVLLNIADYLNLNTDTQRERLAPPKK
ncbi:MAG: DUF3536 domain-containing protein [Myxococcales bacterium]|nr:DUF3536 domain-containing protein [Myxococcales bacterium]